MDIDRYRHDFKDFYEKFPSKKVNRKIMTTIKGFQVRFYGNSLIFSISLSVKRFEVGDLIVQ